MSDPQRCRRCEFLDDERAPIGEDGLCLWCRMALTGVDPHEFYTSGAWMNEIEWRGDKMRGNALRQRIRERMEECGDTTIRSVAFQYSLSETTLGNYMHKRNRREEYISARIVAAMVDYLVLSFKQVMELAGHPRLYFYRNRGRIRLHPDPPGRCEDGTTGFDTEGISGAIEEKLQPVAVGAL